MPDPIIYDVSYHTGPNFPPSGGNKSRNWFADPEVKEADRQREVEMRGRAKT